MKFWFDFSDSKIFISLIFLNFFAFVSKFIGGLISKSAASTSHSLDMLIDSFGSILSLFAIKKGDSAETIVSLIKAFLLLLFGVSSIYSSFRLIFDAKIPDPEALEFFTFISIGLNLISIGLLFKKRNSSILLKSSWLAVRNDFIVNILFLINTIALRNMKSLIVEFFICISIGFLFLHSFIVILFEVIKKFKGSKIQQRIFSFIN